jgi:hypothetical protein
MPGEGPIFTPSSILFRPHQKPPLLAGRQFLVEAPGTAPGSDWLIASAVYRHSQPEADAIRYSENRLK